MKWSSVCRSCWLAASLLGAASGWAQSPGSVAPALAPADTQAPELAAPVIGMHYNLSVFDNPPAAPWHQGWVEYQRPQQWGTWIARVGVVQRFGQTALQPEVDAYPKWGKKTYFYLHLGTGFADIVPKVRWAAEVFRALPHAWEVSVGIRGLNYRQGYVPLYTASLSRYVGNWMLTYRPFVATVMGSAFVTHTAQARLYSGDGQTYWSVMGGAGFLPNQIVTFDDLRQLSTAYIGIQAKQHLSARCDIMPLLMYTQEEVREGTGRSRFTVQVGFEFKLPR